MPYLDIRIAAPCPDDPAERLAARLTSLTAGLLAKKHELTSVSVQIIDTGRWLVGGRPAGAPGAATFFVEANVTAGTNDAAQKAAFIATAFAAGEEILGPCEPASYVIVREVPAEAWGYAGVTQAERAAEKERGGR